MVKGSWLPKEVLEILKLKKVNGSSGTFIPMTAQLLKRTYFFTV